MVSRAVTHWEHSCLEDPPQFQSAFLSLKNRSRLFSLEYLLQSLDTHTNTHVAPLEKAAARCTAALQAAISGHSAENLLAPRASPRAQYILATPKATKGYGYDETLPPPLTLTLTVQYLSTPQPSTSRSQIADINPSPTHVSPSNHSDHPRLTIQSLFGLPISYVSPSPIPSIQETQYHQDAIGLSSVGVPRLDYKTTT
ncbi:hypothetical protein DFH28DRAFT_1130857 [Melampsora americana]|nr:hypothetical protein DFH28DRAFT_1130857 [Melampsora americana]